MSSLRVSSCRAMSSKSAGSVSCALPRTQICSRQRVVQVKAQDGGPPKPSGEKPKRFITRDEEPDEFWKSKAEADGNVFKDPLAIVGILAIFLPFILLAVFGGTGMIDFSEYRGN
eukprot:gene23035-30229_t